MTDSNHFGVEYYKYVFTYKRVMDNCSFFPARFRRQTGLQ